MPSEEQLKRAFQVASYTPEGSDQVFLPGLYSKLEKKLRHRGIDPSSIDSLDSMSDLLPNIGSAAKVSGRKKQNLMTKAGAFKETVDLEKQERRRQESINIAKDALDAFLEDDTYDDLLARIRNLPSTLSAEDVEFLKRTTIERVRSQEVSRLRRIASSIGLRGLGVGDGGGAIAALAESAAADADRQIDLAFSSILLEKMQADRNDALQSISLERSLMDQKRNSLLSLESAYRQALDPSQMMSVTQPTNNLASFYEAIAAREMAADIASANRRSALLGAGIGAVGTIAGSFLGGPAMGDTTPTKK